MFGLTKEETAVMRKLSTPIKIQNFLDSIPVTLKNQGETIMSPRRVLRERTSMCLEGALLAAAALWFHGNEPLIMDLQAYPHDYDHVVALYKVNGYWGALSKTNHATVRFRDPIYRTPRELAVSYFHEYSVNETGKKVLASYSRPINLKRIGTAWITAEDDLWEFETILDNAPHYRLVPKENKQFIRKADKMERVAGGLLEWK